MFIYKKYYGYPTWKAGFLPALWLAEACENGIKGSRLYISDMRFNYGSAFYGSGICASTRLQSLHQFDTDDLRAGTKRVYADRLINSRFIYNGHSVREKVTNYLFYSSGDLEQHRIVLECTRDELADMMSIPRSSLSRELGALADEGIILYDKYSITILDMDRIRDLM